jgi:Iron-dependent Transcriptional regulator
MLSQTAEYALRAVLYLAADASGQPVRVSEMATELGIPQNYLSKILHLLARGGVLASSSPCPRNGWRCTEWWRRSTGSTTGAAACSGAPSAVIAPRVQCIRAGKTSPNGSFRFSEKPRWPTCS